MGIYTQLTFANAVDRIPLFGIFIEKEKVVETPTQKQGVFHNFF